MYQRNLEKRQFIKCSAPFELRKFTNVIIQFRVLGMLRFYCLMLEKLCLCARLADLQSLKYYKLVNNLFRMVTISTSIV